MEDLLPLIIIVALSIIGAIGKKRKKDLEGNKPIYREPMQRDEEIFNWLEKMGITDDRKEYEHGEESEYEEAIQPEVVAPKSVSQEYFSDKQPSKYSGFNGFISPEEREDIMSKEGISVVKKKPISIDSTDNATQIKDIENSKSENPRIDFDLRKAVIYSEILKPKYV
jgi:hypothetical protein